MTHPEPRHKLTVKVGDALRTIQGYTMEEFQMARAEAYDDLAEDLDLVMKAKAVGNAGPAVNTAAAPAPVATGDQWASPPPVPAGPVPVGPDGRPRVAKSGTSAKGPWKAWMTAAKKGEPGYADPIWIQRGTPEWNNFPG
jgi:hypothetical protein